MPFWFCTSPPPPPLETSKFCIMSRSGSVMCPHVLRADIWMISTSNYALIVCTFLVYQIQNRPGNKTTTVYRAALTAAGYTELCVCFAGACCIYVVRRQSQLL
jgi:hypothetical protein